MDLKLTRIRGTAEASIGLLRLEGEVVAFTCEDERRAVKLAGETRIPAGAYRVVPREHGGHWQRYTARWPGWHRGMLEVAMVPGFTDILFHIGNSEKDTAGCILVGLGADLGTMRISRSTAAYMALYPRLIAAAEAGDLGLVIEDRERA